jgi:hypothetical protein
MILTLIRPLSLTVSGPSIRWSLASGRDQNCPGVVVGSIFEYEGGLFPQIAGRQDVDVDVPRESRWVLDERDIKASRCSAAGNVPTETVHSISRAD